MGLGFSLRLVVRNRNIFKLVDIRENILYKWFILEKVLSLGVVIGVGFY